MILTDFRSKYQADPVIMNLDPHLATVEEEGDSTPKIVIEQVQTYSVLFHIS